MASLWMRLARVSKSSSFIGAEPDSAGPQAMQKTTKPTTARASASSTIIEFFISL
jgi:hypothetical protein